VEEREGEDKGNRGQTYKGREGTEKGEGGSPGYYGSPPESRGARI